MDPQSTADLRPDALLALLGTPPVGVAFVAEPPAGIPRIERPAASSCTYWRLAQNGRTFYTEAADHFGCAVGAYTHGAPLPAKEQQELAGLVATMVGLSYLAQEEVAQLPHRPEPMRYVVYGPLADLPCPPDLVILRGTPRQLMLLGEASRAAGCADAVPVMGRPACSMVPQVLASARTATSLGCIGNRVYTELADEQGYLALPGAALPAVLAKLQVIEQANAALQAFHQQRRQAAESAA